MIKQPKFCSLAMFLMFVVVSSVGGVAFADLSNLDIGLVDGSKLTASIKSIGIDGTVQGEGIPTGLNIGDVVSIATERSASEFNSKKTQILTIGGGRLLVSSPTVEEERVRFSSKTGLQTLPLQSVRAIVWGSSPSLDKSLASPSTETDRILAQNDKGEIKIDGLLEMISATHVHVNYRGKSRKIELSKIKAVITADLNLPKPSGSLATILLTDGSKFAGVISGVEAGKMALDVAGAGKIEFETSRIVNVSILSDRLIYLSDLEPVLVEEKSVFAIQRTWQRDQSVERNQLSIRSADGETATRFNKGIGAQSYSNLTYENVRDFDRFSATVGIAAETTGGDCQMVVLGDGIELWSQRVKASGGPLKVDVEIEGMKQISLIVYPGEQFDLGDHANWCNARFLKTK